MDNMRIRADEAYEQLRRDPCLKPIVEKWGKCRLRPGNNYLLEIIKSIIAQQISTKVANKLTNELVKYLRGNVTAESISALEVEELRKLGISSRKAATILTVSSLCSSGKIRLDDLAIKSDREIYNTLTGIKGVGPWTVTMFLIFALNRPRVVPSGDFGIRKAIQIIYGLQELPSVESVKEYYTAWAPHETAASWYLWRSLDNG